MADSTRAKGDLSNLQGERSRKLALDFKDVYAAKEASPELKNQIDALRRDGFLVLRNVLSRGSLDEIRQALGPYIREGKKANLGRNNFEGHKTNRVYALLAKSRAFDQIAENKRVLDIMDRVLMPNYLLSACLAIDIHPGETPQPFHYDGQYIRMERPRPPMGISTIWALGEQGFTAANGGTVILKGSHLWGGQIPTEEEVAKSRVPLEMPPGSVVIFFDTLWHCGGRNVTKEPRLAITAQYCQPFIRQQESLTLSVPPETIPKLSKRLSGLLGYSIHPPFIGHVDGQHPLKSLPPRRSAL